MVLFGQHLKHLEKNGQKFLIRQPPGFRIVRRSGIFGLEPPDLLKNAVDGAGRRLFRRRARHGNVFGRSVGLDIRRFFRRSGPRPDRLGFFSGGLFGDRANAVQTHFQRHGVADQTVGRNCDAVGAHGDNHPGGDAVGIEENDDRHRRALHDRQVFEGGVDAAAGSVELQNHRFGAGFPGAFERFLEEPHLAVGDRFEFGKLRQAIDHVIAAGRIFRRRHRDLGRHHPSQQAPQRQQNEFHDPDSPETHSGRKRSAVAVGGV
ncbi:hypothetical protein SDC9_145884 [bioreactor metagenome]|uniref:Uncharacterized protein n=1 Tax=bioreactor metagenome TaxID=1076179 RepID=A0A645EAP1_9ZZZZ